MFRFCWIIVLVLGIAACQQQQTPAIGIQIDGKIDDAIPVLTIGDRIFPLVLDTLGYAGLKDIEIIVPTEGMLQYGKYRLPLYLEPGKNLEVYLNLISGSLGAEFRGEGALKNEVFNGKYFEMPLPDYGLEETAFIASLESVMRQYERIADSLQLESEFARMVKERIRYKLFADLGIYPELHARSLGQKIYTPTDKYLDYVKTLIAEDATLLKLPDYRRALLGWIRTYCQGKLRQSDELTLLMAELEFIGETLKDFQIVEFLTDTYVRDYIREEGIDSLHRIQPYYEANVKGIERKRAFTGLCAQWRKIASGEPALTFAYLNADSVKVTLSELRGKYVYLYFWKTTCERSVQEMASLKDLELRFKKKNICWVAVSCDEEQDVWEHYIEMGNPVGIQLFGAGAGEQLEFYRIHRLPYAVLIDPEGRIVYPDMPLPADKKAIDMLKQTL